MSAPRAAPIEGEHPIAMVSVTSTAGYRGEIRAGRHRIVADEGPEVGGDDEGPNPYQLILAGLVQCTAATLRMYANRKGWALGRGEGAGPVAAHRRRRHQGGAGRAHHHRVRRPVAEQKQRLAEIADRTPVTRTLLGSLTVDTTLT